MAKYCKIYNNVTNGILKSVQLKITYQIEI